MDGVLDEHHKTIKHDYNKSIFLLTFLIVTGHLLTCVVRRHLTTTIRLWLTRKNIKLRPLMQLVLYDWRVSTEYDGSVVMELWENSSKLN